MRTIFAAAVFLACAPAAAQTQPGQQPQQSAPSPDVDRFARDAAQNSLAEVLMSSIALQKTQDKRVQDYAWTMLDHHSRAMGDLAEALSPGAAALPSEPSAQQTAMLTRMRAMSPQAFDQAYFAHQLQAHGQAVTLFEQGSRLSDQSVAQYARSTLPVLRAHREIAQVKQAQPAQPLPGQ